MEPAFPMLKRLRMQHFVLVSNLELELGPGLTVLTGETGAGKSIILDALDAALGGEVGRQVIRPGASKALVEAVFAPTSATEAWLQECEIDLLDGEVICSREITAKQSRSRVNGILVNRQQMQSLRGHLVEITVQGQTWQLHDPQTQRRWLDALGGKDLLKVRQQVQFHHQQWWSVKQQLEAQQRQHQERLQRQDLITFQAQELNQARLQDGEELRRLEKERDRLSHTVELQNNSLQVYRLLEQGEGDGVAISELLARAEKTVTAMVAYDAGLQPILDMISSALIQVEESARQLYQYGEAQEADPQRLEKVERRIQTLRLLCRKYGPSLAEVMHFAERVNAELTALQGDSGSLEALIKQEQDLLQTLKERCQRLTQLRQQAATKLEKALVTELKPLGMANVHLQVAIEPGSLSAEGHDQITYLFSPNPGQPLQPLSAIASGGEMSRLLLALKVVFSQVDPVATMVFDEIDTGVSGKVAQAIARTLQSLAKERQILVVTHQPLIAAVAQHHLRVQKVIADEQTFVHVEPLEGSQRRQELAQLAGGYAADEALAFVDSLLAQADIPHP
ncbi:MAG: DNA repair protein RecN [Synechococcales cyanobacterium]